MPGMVIWLVARGDGINVPGHGALDTSLLVIWMNFNVVKAASLRDIQKFAELNSFLLYDVGFAVCMIL